MVKNRNNSPHQQCSQKPLASHRNPSLQPHHNPGSKVQINLLYFPSLTAPLHSSMSGQKLRHHKMANVLIRPVRQMTRNTRYQRNVEYSSATGLLVPYPAHAEKGPNPL